MPIIVIDDTSLRPSEAELQAFLAKLAKLAKGFDPSQPRQPKGSSQGGEFMSVGDITDDDVDEWKAAHQKLTGVDQGYKDFINNIFTDLDSDNDSPVEFLALREGKQIQALLGYGVDDVKEGEAGVSETGKYLTVVSLAVAPWNHPSQPNRKKGYGTKLFMHAVKMLLKDRKLKGLVLASMDAASDKFYDALGLRSHYDPMVGHTEYSLDRYEAKDLYDAYQARLRRR